MKNRSATVIPIYRSERPTRKVIFADHAVVKFSALLQWFKKDGLVGETVSDPNQLLSRVSGEPFDICVVNLLLGGIGPFNLISNIRSTSKNQDIKIIVVSKQVHKLNIQNSIQAGANDFVGEPFQNENLYHRINYHLAPKTIIEVTSGDAFIGDPTAMGFVRLLVESTEQLSQVERGKEHPAFLKILQEVAEMTSSNRASIVLVDSEDGKGVVLATSDDPNFHNFPIDLAKYPEVLHVANTGSIIIADDVKQNQLTQKISETVKSITIGSLMVFPVRFHNEVIGTLIVRRPTATDRPSMGTLRVLQSLANVLGAHSSIRHGLRKIYKNYSSTVE